MESFNLFNYIISITINISENKIININKMVYLLFVFVFIIFPNRVNGFINLIIGESQLKKWKKKSSMKILFPGKSDFLESQFDEITKSKFSSKFNVILVLKIAFKKIEKKNPV